MRLINYSSISVQRERGCNEWLGSVCINFHNFLCNNPSHSLMSFSRSLTGHTHIFVECYETMMTTTTTIILFYLSLSPHNHIIIIFFCFSLLLFQRQQQGISACSLGLYMYVSKAMTIYYVGVFFFLWSFFHRVMHGAASPNERIMIHL